MSNQFKFYIHDCIITLKLKKRSEMQDSSQNQWVLEETSKIEKLVLTPEFI